MSIPYKLYQGDALRVLQSLESNSVDMVITDPPYSSGGQFRGDRMADTETKYKGFSNGDENWKAQTEYPEFTGDNRDQRGYLYWCALWIGECQRILKAGGLFFMFTDWRQLPTTTDAIQAGGLIWRGVTVWDKGVGRPMKGRFRNHLEYICWASNGAMRDVQEVYPSSIFYAAPPSPNERQHRTEKPTELIKAILEMSKADGVVLDPFMGSGTTGVACVETGRSFIGCELTEQYFKIAESRLSQSQPSLFAPVHEAQQSVQRTGGESGQQNLFTVGNPPPAKVTAKSPRR